MLVIEINSLITRDQALGWTTKINPPEFKYGISTSTRLFMHSRLNDISVISESGAFVNDNHEECMII